MATCLFCLVTFFLLADAYQPQIKVYEITKTRYPDYRVDSQYYDPELTRNERNNNRNLNNLANYINNKLGGDNDDIYKYSDEETVIIDKTRTLPVIILPADRTVYRKKPRNYKILHKLLHSALRTNGAEDRTAPPRHRGNYDDHNYH